MVREVGCGEGSTWCLAEVRGDGFGPITLLKLRMLCNIDFSSFLCEAKKGRLAHAPFLTFVVSCSSFIVLTDPRW